MIVLQEENVIIIHTPKCAGKVLRQAFMPDNPEGQYWHWKYISEISSWADCAHLPLSILKQLPEWEKIKTFTVIAIVRNPYKRFISSCNEHTIQHPSESIENIINNIDEIRINYDPRYIHFMPQNRFTHIGNKRHVDFIARTENLKNDLISIAKKCNLGSRFLDSIDLIPEYEEQVNINKIYFESNHDKIFKTVKRLYFRDFILFGFDIPKIEINIENTNHFDYLTMDPSVVSEWNDYNYPQEAYERFLERKSNTLKIENLTKDRNEIIKDRDEIIKDRDEIKKTLLEVMKERDFVVNNIEILKNENIAILNSTSWKLTKFLRSVKNITKCLISKNN